MANNTVKVVSIIAVAFLIGVFIFTNMVLNVMNYEDDSTVETNGVASVKTLPDKVSINIGIETLDDSAELAKNENAKISEKAMVALLKIVDKKDIQTENFNIYEEFDWNEGTRKSRGFKVTNTLKVQTEDFDEVGKIVDAAINAGATGINGVYFEISEERTAELKKEVLEKASKDAREKAEAIAAGLNSKVGKVISVSTSDYGYNPYPIYMAKAEDSAVGLREAVTNIAPTELDVSANVHVTFELK
jgi:uncharacterized protein